MRRRRVPGNKPFARLRAARRRTHRRRLGSSSDEDDDGGGKVDEVMVPLSLKDLAAIAAIYPTNTRRLEIANLFNVSKRSSAGLHLESDPVEQDGRPTLTFRTQKGQEVALPQDCIDILLKYKPNSVLADLESVLDLSDGPKHYTVYELASLPPSEISVGGFHKQHPNESGELLANHFAINLVSPARKYIHHFCQAASELNLSSDGLSFTQKFRFEMFLELQHKHSNLVLVPPKDVLRMWLARLVYKCNDNPRDKKIDEVMPCWLLLSEAEMTQRGLSPMDENQTRTLWQQNFSTESNSVCPYDYSESQPLPPTHSMFAIYSDGIFSDDSWFNEFLTSVNYDVTKLDDDRVVHALLKHYERFLFLLGKYPKRKLMPPVPVEVIWRAHQCFGNLYVQDMLRLLGRKVVHEQLPQDDADEQRNLCETLWINEFPDVPFPRTI